MSIAALDNLRAAFADLRAALDGDDMAAVDSATKRVKASAIEARAVGAWRDEPAVRDRLSDLMPLIDAARIRANILSDQARQRIDLLAVRGAAQAPMTYGR